MLFVAAAPVLALALRQEVPVSDVYLRALMEFIALALLVKLPTFYGFGLYNHDWRYVGTDELVSLVLAVTAASVVLVAVLFGAQVFGLVAANGFPSAVPILDGLVTLMTVGAARFAARAFGIRTRAHRETAPRRRILIVGAGDAGALIARELHATGVASEIEAVGFVDDDPVKQGVRIYGVQVLGTRAQLQELIAAHKVQEVFIAMPAVPGKVIRQVVRACQAAGVPYKTLPALHELPPGEASINHLRRVEIEDLLRREPLEMDMTPVAAMVAGQRVLVTGAGGSVGSELCRQVFRRQPAQLILLGYGENSLCTLADELSRLKLPGAGPRPDVKVVGADGRDLPRLQVVFERLRPQIVFHAAAHTHVLLMEDNIEDAVSSNVAGTRNLAELSESYGVGRFVLTSTDEAVNPASVMGATKRVAEHIVRLVAQRSRLPYVSVRFGNVLGSRGSVVPLFRQQIAEGGPVTVTHPDMLRYFMTIPEAVQLVLQAAAFGDNGETFVLDMGQPVRIADLARDLIELSGLQVGRDIDITYTGLRPGEKLFEELFLGGEGYGHTQHQRIFVSHADALPPDPISFHGLLNNLLAAAQSGRQDEVRHWLKALLPEYNSGPVAQCAPPPASPRATVLPGD